MDVVHIIWPATFFIPTLESDLSWDRVLRTEYGRVSRDRISILFLLGDDRVYTHVYGVIRDRHHRTLPKSRITVARASQSTTLNDNTVMIHVPIQVWLALVLEMGEKDTERK